ncbi:MOSC domain-containing protein [Dyadobacter sp. CY356]|uniref:MOSC domain-containing protein n=1 Tax=Dyadobacter sp. CY356 TaxID=2906442 RepID=UPI001F19D65C|nr:MOSC N-terminal beta barrel domain-containing protein [Dyadobacter sp. CY356]MCF0054987.1 MOSC domain-containing protein [Dyadobacter sp. CY356]
MFLSEIWIYPVKSLGGIRQTQAVVEEKGLQYDRRWMIVDENGKFLTQRVNPNMALLDVEIHTDGLIISRRFQTDNQILVPFEANSNQTIQVKVWEDTVLARTICDKADAWLTRQLGKSVRIVEMSEQTKRKMDPAYSGKESLVSFADDFPYLLISEGSLQDLNSRLAQPVTMRRFRPNFIISGTEPFAEDSWKKVRIGQVEFIVAKPCERCILVGIDPVTGQKGSEPLKTLSSYRKVGKNIFFGQNLVSRENGLLQEGDELVITEP